MNKIAIVADSTCDLSEELLKKYDISICPLHVYLGEEEYIDRVNITPKEIYEWSDEHKSTPKTSAISLFEAMDFLEKKLAEADEIIAFTISSEMSSCLESFHWATGELQAADRVFTIDSRNLSTGIGLQIIAAAEMAQQGMTAEEIVKKIKELQPHVRASFMVDTLTYLYRGGRCSGLAALTGSTLKLHPCIVVRDGAMNADKKYRGNMKKVIHQYVEDLRPALETALPDRVFITSSDCDEEIVNMVKEQLEELNHFREILITSAGSVISCHCGPGTLGVLFIAGDR